MYYNRDDKETDDLNGDIKVSTSGEDEQSSLEIVSVADDHAGGTNTIVTSDEVVQPTATTGKATDGVESLNTDTKSDNEYLHVPPTLPPLAPRLPVDTYRGMPRVIIISDT